MKKSITCKGISFELFNEKIIHTYTPKMGDLAVFEVIDIGKHDSIQGINGNNCYLFEGDEFLAAFGNRYATEQFEGYVPDEPTIDLEILGKGGVVGIMKSMHYKFKDIGTTKVRLKSFAVDQNGDVLNSIYYNKEKVSFKTYKKPSSPIILSLGCSMDSGKTTTAAFLSRSLKLVGAKVAFIKLTGTQYTKDSHFVRDCGAAISMDFGYVGYPATYMINTDEILDIFAYLLTKVEKENPDYIVIEIADGLYQRETEALLSHNRFKSFVDKVIFSAVDSLSAIQGYNFLIQKGLKPFAISGLFTASPLLHKEVASRIDVPIYNLETLIENVGKELFTVVT